MEGRGRYVTSVIVHLMKMNRKGCGRKRSLSDFNNCTRICMEGLLKASETCNGFCSVRDSSQTLPLYELAV